MNASDLALLKAAMERSTTRRDGHRVLPVNFPTHAIEKDQWRGVPCVIVGGGPSAKALFESGAFHRFMERTRWISVNVSGLKVFGSAPDVAYVGDERVLRLLEVFYPLWWQNCSLRLLWYGLKDLKTDHECRHVGLATGCDWGPGPCYVSQGGCAGLKALNIADGLGSAPIYLLGFDLMGSAGKTAWAHDHYPEEFRQDDVVYGTYLEAFRDQVPREVKDRCVVVGESRLVEVGFKSCAIEELA